MRERSGVEVGNLELPLTCGPHCSCTVVWRREGRGKGGTKYQEDSNDDDDEDEDWAEVA